MDRAPIKRRSIAEALSLSNILMTIGRNRDITEKNSLISLLYISPMIEQLTLLLATPIAKAILDKFYEGVGSKLGEKAVELLPEKVKQLGQLVWTKCLRGKPGTDEMLQKAANGSVEEQKKLAEYLCRVLETDLTLRQETQTIATEIYQVIQVEDVTVKNVQQVFGGEADQFNTENVNAPMIQGGSGHTVNISYGVPPTP